MKFSTSIGFLMGSYTIFSASASCPGSKAGIHAKCELEIVFPLTDCEMVQEEMTRRMAGDFGWTDPHNEGKYKLESVTAEVLKGSRRTGDNKYTDLFEMTFLSNENGDCVVQACSESQVTSVIDFSTNYCNIRNLYCSSKLDDCPTVKYDLHYVETYKNCRQRDVSKCVPSLHGGVDTVIY